ncbi:MAG: lipoyl synthase [Candidatus Marinimicrobia bacterium]|nr:lipoyl synthase [Candidatus Neomarinimicrobiota bacterium]
MIKIETPPIVKKPKWLKVKLNTGENFKDMKNLMKENSLNTVCEEARCPNIYECWDSRTATVMILGDTCTRSCGFCSVKTGKPDLVDNDEPARVADLVKKLNLRHVVITSVDRDDLKGDYGARIWYETVSKIKEKVPKCTVEILTPDFRYHKPALNLVYSSKPDIFSHNIECVKRISKSVRRNSDWDRTLNVLKHAVDNGMLAKTGMMVGLGETDEEVFEAMKFTRSIGVEIFNIGQYLQPTIKHLPVDRYVEPEIFSLYKNYGLKIGFKVVESGPLVRSSYHADQQARLYNKNSLTF